MNTRIMTIDDYDSAFALWMSTPNMGLNNLDDTREGIEKFLVRNPNTCFVTEVDNRIVGVVLCGHDGRRGYIHHAAVEGDMQRQGIGTKLVAAAVTALEEEGINKVALSALATNDKGNDFWEKQGFTTRPDLIYRNKTLADLTRIYTTA